eukprot:gene25078-33591_t
MSQRTGIEFQPDRADTAAQNELLKQRRIKKLKHLIRRGVPPELRGSVWWACSGASKIKETFVSTHYADLVGNLENQRGIPAYNDIMKDLNRTFSAVLATMDKNTETPIFPTALSHDTVVSSEDNSNPYTSRSLSTDEPPYYSRESFLAALKRVLLAYAVHNRRVGYCQSMNYICALLLFHVRDEERVFWILATIVEDICSNYYLPTFIGVRSDNLVLQALLAHYSPRLFAKFKATDTILEPIIMPWFLCLYINALPNYAVCRVWDCIFWQGREVLFRVALHLLNSKSKLIQKVNDFASVYSILKSENMGTENSFMLESPTKQSNSSFWNLSQSMNTLPIYQLPFSKRPRRIVSGYAFTFGLEDNYTQDISTAEHLITATFAKRLIFIRSKVYSLRSKIMQHLLSMDKLQRISTSQSRPISTEIMGQGIMDAAVDKTSRYSLQLGVCPEFEETVRTPVRDSACNSETPSAVNTPVVTYNIPAVTIAEFTADRNRPDESRRQSESYVRINSSTGMKTAFFTAPRMTYLQRMSFRTDNMSVRSESCYRINSTRSESCYRIQSTCSSKGGKDKHLSLIRVITEEDLSIQDIHCLGLDLREEFEMDVGKLVRGMKNLRNEGTTQNEAIAEEDEWQEEGQEEEYEEDKEQG